MVYLVRQKLRAENVSKEVRYVEWIFFIYMFSISK